MWLELYVPETLTLLSSHLEFDLHKDFQVFFKPEKKKKGGNTVKWRTNLLFDLGGASDPKDYSSYFKIPCWCCLGFPSDFHLKTVTPPNDRKEGIFALGDTPYKSEEVCIDQGLQCASNLSPSNRQVFIFVPRLFLLLRWFCLTL